jgi:hypothetical protein
VQSITCSILPESGADFAACISFLPFITGLCWRNASDYCHESCSPASDLSIGLHPAIIGTTETEELSLLQFHALSIYNDVLGQQSASSFRIRLSKNMILYLRLPEFIDGGITLIRSVSSCLPVYSVTLHKTWIFKKEHCWGKSRFHKIFSYFHKAIRICTLQSRLTAITTEHT